MKKNQKSMQGFHPYKCKAGSIEKGMTISDYIEKSFRSLSTLEILGEICMDLNLDCEHIKGKDVELNRLDLTGRVHSEKEVEELVQPETSQDQLETDQPMKEPEIIVANRTCCLSNQQYESSEDKASGNESSGRTGMRAINRAVVTENEFCSLLRTATGIRFKWKPECDEPLFHGRSQYSLTSRVNASGRHSGVWEAARLNMSDGQTGKFHAQRWSLGECVMPTSWVVHGMADVVVVAMTPGITSRKSEGPLDIVAWRKRGHRILSERTIRSSVWGSESISKCM